MHPAQHASTTVRIPHPGKRCRRHEKPALLPALHFIQQGLKAGIIPKHVMGGIYVRHGKKRVPFQPGVDNTVVSHHDVGRLKIAVHDACCMRPGEGRCDVGSNGLGADRFEPFCGG